VAHAVRTEGLTKRYADTLAVDAWHDAVTAHRRLGYVSAEPSLWPGLTGAETLEFLARVRGGADTAYRDLLVQRFQLETSDSASSGSCSARS
jgi:ABC-2 type transport system ATP-binding protein